MCRSSDRDLFPIPMKPSVIRSVAATAARPLAGSSRGPAAAAADGGEGPFDAIDPRLGVGDLGGGGLLRLLPLAFKFLGVKGTLIAALGIGAYLYFSGGGLGGLAGQ